MKIAVLLVNYNQWDLTRLCLDSLMASSGVETVPILVDNGSSTPPPGWLSEYPGLRFRALERNTGFAEGNNIAFSMLEEGEADYLFLINPDATVSPPTLRLLADFLETHPAAAVASSAVFYHSNPSMVWSAGGRFMPTRMLLDQRFNTRREDLPKIPVQTDFASGCALMVRTEVYRSLGGFPADYFMYWEDVEFCLRLGRLGMKVFLIPGAEVLHRVAACSGGPGSPVAIYYPFRNRFLLAAEILDPFRRAVFTVYASIVVLTKSILFPLRRSAYLVPVIWRAYRDGICGRKGPWLKASGMPASARRSSC